MHLFIFHAPFTEYKRVISCIFSVHLRRESLLIKSYFEMQVTILHPKDKGEDYLYIPVYPYRLRAGNDPSNVNGAYLSVSK